MRVKTKRTQIALLAILLLGVLLQPVTGTRAEARPARILDDALMLMATSELWLTGGGEPVEAIRRSSAPGLLSVATAAPAGSARQTEVAINAVKTVIAMKEQAFQDASTMLEGKVSAETLDDRETAHQDDMQRLNNSLESLRREWRRQKRFFPKLAKPFKQAGGWFWYKIGPAGRSILRAVGDELIQVVVTGDPVTGKVVRMLLVKHIRRVGVDKGKQFLVRVLLRGQVDEDETGTGGEGQVEKTEEGGGSGEGGQPETAEETKIEYDSFDEFWGDVFIDLSLHRKHCNADAVTYYRDCLRSTADLDGDWAGAVESCQQYADGLKSYPSGHVILEDKHFQFRDDDNYLRLEYDTGSGQVNGYLDLVFDDYGSGAVAPENPSCTISKFHVFSGTLDEEACKMSGKGQVTTSWEGDGDVCAWTDMQSDPGTYPFDWSANIIRGTINGNVGEYALILSFEEHQVPNDG